MTNIVAIQRALSNSRGGMSRVPLSRTNTGASAVKDNAALKLVRDDRVTEPGSIAKYPADDAE